MTRIAAATQADEDLIRLTGEELAFVRAYIETDDKIEAAKAVWPDQERPAWKANQMLRSARVATALARARGALLDEVGMSRGEILQELRYMARYNPQDYIDENGLPVPLWELPERHARALGDVEYVLSEGGGVIPAKLKTTKIKALELLAKAGGMLDKSPDQSGAAFYFDLSITPEPARPAAITVGGRVLDIQATRDG